MVPDHIKSLPGGLKKIGIIATNGTIKSGLFQRLFEKNGLEIITPGPDGQMLFMEAVYGEKGIKRGYKEEPKQKLLELNQLLILKKVDAVIAGCTEIPLVLSQRDMKVPFIDPLRIMAETAVRKAGYRVKPQA